MIPLDYQTPEPKTASRQTSTATRFACGIGLGILGVLVVAALRGDIDIPIGPACSSVMFVASGGGAFWATGRYRKIRPNSSLFERSKILTVAVGAVCVSVFVAAASVLPFDSRDGTWISLGVWAGLSIAANWIAVRRATSSE